jgi:hypothetical protein
MIDELRVQCLAGVSGTSQILASYVSFSFLIMGAALDPWVGGRATPKGITPVAEKLGKFSRFIGDGVDVLGGSHFRDSVAGIGAGVGPSGWYGMKTLESGATATSWSWLLDDFPDSFVADETGGVESRLGGELAGSGREAAFPNWATLAAIPEICVVGVSGRDLLFFTGSWGSSDPDLESNVGVRNGAFSFLMALATTLFVGGAEAVVEEAFAFSRASLCALVVRFILIFFMPFVSESISEDPDDFATGSSGIRAEDGTLGAGGAMFGRLWPWIPVPGPVVGVVFRLRGGWNTGFQCLLSWKMTRRIASLRSNLP